LLQHHMAQCEHNQKHSLQAHKQSKQAGPEMLCCLNAEPLQVTCASGSRK
jgi:hypothetical protein